MEKFSNEIKEGSAEQEVIKNLEEGDKTKEQFLSIYNFNDEFKKFLFDNVENSTIIDKFWGLRVEFNNKYKSLLENMFVLTVESKISKEPISEGGFDLILQSMHDLTKLINEIQTKMDEKKAA